MTAHRSIRRAAFTFIFITVLLDMLALGIVIPVLPKLVLDFVGGDAVARRRLSRPVRHRLGADAVPVLADPRRAVGPLRAAADHPDVEFRARPRLHPDGAGADAGLAVRRPDHLRHHRGSRSRPPMPMSPTSPSRTSAPQLFGMLGVAFGAGFVLGPAIGGIAGSYRSAAAVLDRGGLEPAQRRLRAAHPSGIAAAGEARAVQLAARQSDRLADPAALASAAALGSRW